MSNGWQRVPLAEVILHRKEFIEIDDTQSYKRPRVQLHAQGVILRDEIEGASIKTKRQQVCRTDEFLVAEIDAKVGGFGMVPENLNGSIVSSHYFLFEVIRNRLDPRFLGWYVKTPGFREQVSARGSTNYAAIRPQHVLTYEIPLPPLAEQRRIVAKIERLAGKINSIANLKDARTKETKTLILSAQRSAIGTKVEANWCPLGTAIVDIENGWSPACHPHPATDGRWGVLKVGAVSFGTFNPRENKELPQTFQPKVEYEIKSGDFLMSRANTVELVGACAVVGDTPARLILCDKIFRFQFYDDGRLDPSFLNHVLKSPVLRDQIEVAATGTSPTMRNISKAKILQLRIPVPPRDEQHRIIRFLDDVQAKVRCVTAIQDNAAAELDALLPSILDWAFRGEL